MVARRALTKKMQKMMLSPCFCYVEVISELSLSLNYICKKDLSESGIISFTIG